MSVPVIFYTPSGNNTAVLFDWGLIQNISNFPGTNGYYFPVIGGGNYLGAVCFQNGAAYSFTFITGEGNAGSGTVIAGTSSFTNLQLAYSSGGGPPLSHLTEPNLYIVIADTMPPDWE
jgi:hypothetical protein